MSQHMLFAGARLHTARVGCAVSVAVFSQNAARVESKSVFLCLCVVYPAAAHRERASAQRATGKRSAQRAAKLLIVVKEG